MITCDYCGTQLKNALALRSHEGSRPCQVEATKRRMEKAGWVPTMSFSPVGELIRNAESIEWEDAPVESTPGGMIGGVTGSTGSPVERKKKTFVHPELHMSMWAPKWAVTIASTLLRSNNDLQRNVFVLRRCGYSEDDRNAVLVSIALADTDGVLAEAQRIMAEESERRVQEEVEEAHP